MPLKVRAVRCIMPCLTGKSIPPGSRALGLCGSLRRTPYETHPNAPRTRSFVSFNDFSKLSFLGSRGKDGNSQDKSSTSEKYREVATLPYGKLHLFDIVSSVEYYDQFVPYCVSSRILRGTKDMTKTQSEPQHPNASQDSQKEFLAELAVGFGHLREAYTSRVTLIGSDKVIVSVF